ncbi:MAG: 3'(2'), 5'-bisphosphate nucleotidase [Alphaproteobacteria bacterium]|jgi:3'(2'), 5'-bisphosphate nucleotidase
MHLSDKNYQKLIHIAIDAGQIILDIRHNRNLEIDFKQDQSPVTTADYASNTFIIEALQQHYPDIPIVSEEGVNDVTDMSDLFFLIDPLDGTRDFIEGTQDYCVNIALLQNYKPILGVIYIPERHTCFYACHNQGSFKIPNCDDLSKQEKISVKSISKHKTQTISKRSSANGYQFFKMPITITDTIHAGSAIKFCQIAEGLADIYPRPGNTGEWDTAAGDVIVTEAGGFVGDIHHQPLVYGKSKKNYLNDAFYAANCILSSE